MKVGRFWSKYKQKQILTSLQDLAGSWGKQASSWWLRFWGWREDGGGVIFSERQKYSSKKYPLPENSQALRKHTSYLSFLLHRQDFWKPNFTPKKTTKGTKNTKNVSEKVKYMHFFTQSGKIYTWQKFFSQTCLWCLWQIWGMLSKDCKGISHLLQNTNLGSKETPSPQAINWADSPPPILCNM